VENSAVEGECNRIAGLGGLKAVEIECVDDPNALLKESIEYIRCYICRTEHGDATGILITAARFIRLVLGCCVDVVLKSFAGKQLRATFKCMAPFGRFVKIGKRDITTIMNSPFLTHRYHRGG